MNEQYQTPEEFLGDETFIAWRRGTDEIQSRRWEAWMAGNPANKAVAEEAARMFALLSAEELQPLPEHTLQARDRLMNALNRPVKVVPVHRRRIFRWTAAAVAAAVIVFIAVLFKTDQPVIYATGFGETKSFILPDGSAVTLNANSTLKLAGGWKAGESREVWLNGEGFFDVKHTSRQARFLVHAEDLEVEVLRTKFNVRQRKEQTTVVLESGKVQLHVKDAAALVMAPGELVKYTAGTGNTIRKTVNTRVYTSWKTGKLEFENASIREIAGVLEENYGLTVIIEDAALQGKEFNGVFPADNVDLLLEALSKAYKLNVRRNGREIRLRAAPAQP